MHALYCRKCMSVFTLSFACPLITKNSELTPDPCSIIFSPYSTFLICKHSVNRFLYAEGHFLKRGHVCTNPDFRRSSFANFSCTKRRNVARLRQISKVGSSAMTDAFRSPSFFKTDSSPKQRPEARWEGKLR